jgi:ABC-type antimicrobial peptide transport system permease subunit
VIAVVVIAAAAGIVAALLPAWRASRMNVLDAIHTE